MCVGLISETDEGIATEKLQILNFISV